MQMPLFSVDPMDPRSGRKIPLSTFIIGLIILSAFILVSGWLLSWPHKESDTAVTGEDITAYFESEGFQIYEKREDIPRPIRRNVYLGYLWPESESMWYVGKDSLQSNTDSYMYDDAVYVYFYDLPEDAASAVSGLSSDGRILEAEGLSGSIQINIGRDLNRRVYLYQNIVVYYEGTDEEVYMALEKLCGEPIADGRNIG